MNQQYQPHGIVPQGQHQPPGRYYRPANLPSGSGGSLGWWIASGVMALLLVAGIILLISMLGGGGEQNEGASDVDETAESERTEERRDSESEAYVPPADSDAPDLPEGVAVGDVHVGRYGDILPLLPIPRTDYVFLGGFLLARDDNCWGTNYDIAYKGEWSTQSLDAVFDADEILEAVERELPKLYPEENMKSFDIFIKVYQYNGSKDAADYEDVDPEDINFYVESNGSCGIQ